MPVSVRPFVTSGVALVGASVIAVAPVVVTPQDSKIPAIPAISSAAVDLTAATNPVVAWLEVLTAAGENVGQIAQTAINNPVPALRQLLRNQVGYGETLITALGNVGDALVDQLTVALPAELNAALDELLQGNIAEATYTLSQALVGAVVIPLIELALPFGNAVVDIPGKMAQNFANVVKTLTGLTTVLGIINTALGIPLGVFNAFGDSLQLAANAVAAGDPLDAIAELVNIPANLTGALLNGYQQKFGATNFPGILTPDGPINFVLNVLPQAISEAIGGPPAPASSTASEAGTADAAAGGPADPGAGGGELLTVSTASATGDDATTEESEAEDEDAVDEEQADVDADDESAEDVDEASVSTGPETRGSLKATPGETGLAEDATTDDETTNLDSVTGEESADNSSTDGDGVDGDADGGADAGSGDGGSGGGE